MSMNSMRLCTGPYICFCRVLHTNSFNSLRFDRSSGRNKVQLIPEGNAAKVYDDINDFNGYKRRKPMQPPEPRSLHVALIGTTNAGKSTLINKLIGRPLAAVSSKVHTTRQRAVSVKSVDNKQLVLLDTPGIINPTIKNKYNLEKSMLYDPHASLKEADLIGVVVDASQAWSRARLDGELLKALYIHCNTPSILILNKVDKLHRKRLLISTVRKLTGGIVDGQNVVEKLTIKSDDSKKQTMEARAAKVLKQLQHKTTDKTALHEDGDDDTKLEAEVHRYYANHAGSEATVLSDDQKHAAFRWIKYEKALSAARTATQNMEGWPGFSRVYMISALMDDGVKDIMHYLLEQCIARDWQYHEDMCTDQEPHVLIKNIIRARLLDHLPEEVPYNIPVEVRSAVEYNNVLHIECHLRCESARFASIAMGRSGTTIKRIAMEAESEIEDAFMTEVQLKLSIRQ